MIFTLKELFLEYVSDKIWADEAFIAKVLSYLEQNPLISEEEVFAKLKEREKVYLENLELKKTFLGNCNDKPWINESFIDKGLYYFEQNPLVSKKELVDKLNESEKELKKSYMKVIRNLSNNLPNFDMTIFYPVHCESIIKIKTKNNFFKIKGRYKVLIAPYCDFPYKAFHEYRDEFIEVCGKDDVIEIPYTFQSEQPYLISLNWLVDNEEITLLKKMVYALESDLFGMKYLKGDLHVHTTYSDGCEHPELVISLARKYGLDFVAITDHKNYQGSVIGEVAAKRLGNKITVLRGEECDFSFSPMHILSLGAPQGLNPDYLGDKILELESTKNIITNYAGLACDITAYACTQAFLDQIRENGGVSIICHPLWKYFLHDGKRKDAPYSLLLALFKDKRFDGIELISGSGKNDSDTNNLQDLLFREIGIKYDCMPVIGVTDSHCYETSEIAGLHYTIVFSKNREAESIIEAIRNNRTVAVSQKEKNGVAQCYGSLRYAQFAHFLIKHYFPKQDERAFVEGMEMLDNLYSFKEL